MGEFKFKCPQCSGDIEADDSFCGQMAECPHCGKNIVVPYNVDNAQHLRENPTRQDMCAVSTSEPAVGSPVSQGHEQADTSNCVFCGQSASCTDVYEVEMDDIALTDDRQERGIATFMLPCCEACRQKIASKGVNMFSLRKIPVINEALHNGARFSEKWLAEQRRKVTLNGNIENIVQGRIGDGLPLDDAASSPTHARLEYQYSRDSLDKGGFAMYCRAWVRMFNFGGCASGSEYWGFFQYNILFTILLRCIDLFLGTKILLESYGWVSALPLISLGLRRFRDVGLGIGDWLFLQLSASIGWGVFGFWGTIPNLSSSMHMALVLAIALAISAVIVSLYVCCLKSSQSELPRRKLRLKVYGRFAGLLVFLLLVIFIGYAIFAPAPRPRKSMRRERTKPQRSSYLQKEDIGSNRGASRKVVSNSAAIDVKNAVMDLKNAAKEAKNTMGWASRAAVISGGVNVNIFPNVRVPVPKGYRQVAANSAEDVLLSSLQRIAKQEGIDVKATFVKAGSNLATELFDDMLRIQVNKTLSRKMISSADFEQVKMIYKATFMKIKSTGGKVPEEVENARRRLNRELNKSGVDVDLQYEVLAVRNSRNGLFTSTVCKGAVDPKRYRWILLSQGIILVNGKVLFVVKEVAYKNREDAVQESESQVRFVEEWCDGIKKNRTNTQSAKSCRIPLCCKFLCTCYTKSNKRYSGVSVNECNNRNFRYAYRHWNNRLYFKAFRVSCNKQVGKAVGKCRDDDW